MADSNFRGPISSMGSLEDVNATTSGSVVVPIAPTDGPSMFYQGFAIPDPRTAPFAKDGFRPGQQRAFYAVGTLMACDNIPQARGSATLATTQVMTSAVAVALATVGAAGVASACNIAVGVPIIPVGTTNVTFVIALDFGFTTGTTVTNSTTVSVIDNTLFHVGQWLVLGNVGNAAATRSLIAQVQTIATANTTGITILPAAATGLASIPIGQGNLFGSGQLPLASQFGPAAASANAHSFGGAFPAGLAKVVNPRETLARNITMQGVTSVTYSAVVSGWDVWGNAMTEVISLSAQTSGAGKKAFKYIGSITSGTTISGAIQASFGLGDNFGYPFRADEWDQTEVTWNNTFPTNNNGFTAAVISAATSTTGDVRGTIQISTAVVTGVLGTSVSAIASNGTSRLTMQQNLAAWAQVFATPNNTVPMFGVTQSIATT